MGRDKKINTRNVVKKLRSSDYEKMKKNIRNHNNKIIVPIELKLKNIPKVICKPITPQCRLK